MKQKQWFSEAQWKDKYGAEIVALAQQLAQETGFCWSELVFWDQIDYINKAKTCPSQSAASRSPTPTNQ